MEQSWFYNPIVRNGADPWTIRVGGKYYLCQSDGGGRIVLRFARRLEELENGGVREIYQAPDVGPYAKGIWAPELHYLEERWYCYFAACDGRNETHRMYVLAGGTNPADPLDGRYVLQGKLAAEPDRWAIDGTVLHWQEQYYFIWSGWEGMQDGRQDLYIARMDGPCSIRGGRVRLSSPQEPWETNGYPTINEGPQILQQNGRLFIVYSASGSWTDDYCLGLLVHRGGDVMDPDSWEKRGPVFQKTQQIFGPGHPSFVRSPDGTEHWMVYHVAKHSGSGWDREIHMKPFLFQNGEPVFGMPVAPGAAQAVPSDQKTNSRKEGEHDEKTGDLAQRADPAGAVYSGVCAGGAAGGKEHH